MSTHLAQELAHLARQHHLRIDPLAVPDQPDAEYADRYLRQLPPTPQLREALAVLQAADAEQQALPEDQRDLALLPVLRRRLREARLQLNRAGVRDRLAADRPAGCWCLGFGGKDRVYGLVSAAGEPLLLPDDVPLWRTYCACPDGQQQQARVRALQQQARAAQQAERQRAILGGGNIPARYDGLTFDSYPTVPQTARQRDRVRAWLQGVLDGEGKPGLVLYGPTGAGKTGLAVCAQRAWQAATGQLGHFDEVPDLLDRIRSAYDPGSPVRPDAVLDTARSTPLLVLDDLGTERPTAWVAEKLFQLVNARYGRGLPTIVTSNYDFDALATRFRDPETGDDLIGQRIQWRLAEMSRVLFLDGPNLRDPSQRARLARPTPDPSPDDGEYAF